MFPAISNNFVEPVGMEYSAKENWRKMGIITNCEPLTFIHLKYADYCVAWFIMAKLETGIFIIWYFLKFWPSFLFKYS